MTTPPRSCRHSPTRAATLKVRYAPVAPLARHTGHAPSRMFVPIPTDSWTHSSCSLVVFGFSPLNSLISYWFVTWLSPWHCPTLSSFDLVRSIPNSLLFVVWTASPASRIAHEAMRARAAQRRRGSQTSLTSLASLASATSARSSLRGSRPPSGQAENTRESPVVRICVFFLGIPQTRSRVTVTKILERGLISLHWNFDSSF